MADTNMARPSSAFTTVDLDKSGKQVGFLMIPHSPNDDAWGITRMTLAVIRNGRYCRRAGRPHPLPLGSCARAGDASL